MYNPIVLYTFIALVLFFTGLEIYKFRFYQTGFIVEIITSKNGLDNFIGSCYKVQLKTGQIVIAEAERCTVCMGQFRVGDEVKLLKSTNKFYIHLPAFSLKKNRSCKPV